MRISKRLKQLEIIGNGPPKTVKSQKLKRFLLHPLLNIPPHTFDLLFEPM